jgi:hypothetical protein
MTRAASPAVRSARLDAHGLRAPLESATAVVERLLAVQAQDLPAAKWVVGSRVPGAVLADIDAMLHDRAVIRSWPLRGTLHFVPARSLRPILELSGARELGRAALRHRQLELGEAEHRVARDIAERLLSGGRSMSREELLAAWEAAGVATGGQRGYHLIWWLALEAVLCCGPVEGRVQRFVLLDEWSPAASAAAEREQTLGELLAGYVAGHGPATLRDFAWWTGLTLGDARVALDAAGDRVEPFPGDELRFVAPGGADAASRRPSGAYALAAFDEYFLGYADRAVVCDDRYVERVVPGRNGVFQPLLVADGRVVGVWRRNGRADRPSIALDFFEEPSERLVRRFAAPLAAWARFQGVQLDGIAPANA